MSDSKVVVYTSRDCNKCDLLISKFTDWDIDFEERNISDNREYFKELQRNKVYGTPATFIDGEKILGFQEGKLRRKLGVSYESRETEGEVNFS